MTHSISLIAPAKLNLNLYVKDKLENGYHSLESDVCFLDLYDEIKIEISNFNSIEISNNSNFILFELLSLRFISSHRSKKQMSLSNE